MRNLITKHKFDIIFWASLILAFFASRLSNLGLIPIFTDEAIYLRWSQIMAYDASLRYLPLVDGKPPLFMWLTSTVMRLLPHLDPLLTGRLVSVFAGFGSLIGIYFLAIVLFRDKKIARLSAIFYLLIPFTFFYDRFGLADSLLSMWGIWALSLSILLVRTIRLDIALILGGILGFGLLTKTPAIFFYGFFPLSLLFFDRKNQSWKINFLKWIGLVAISVVISQMFFSILRLFPLFNMIAQKNSSFVISPKEFLRHPLVSLPSNISSFLTWEATYLTLPISLLTIISIIWAFLKRSWLAIFLVLVVVGQLLVMAIFNSSIFPRYLLQITPPILVLASWGLYKIIEKWPLAKRSYLVLVVGLLFIPTLVDFQLLTDPPRAIIADGDSNQYINAWPAGYGVLEIRKFLTQQSEKYPKITVGTEVTFGLMHYALQLYQNKYPSVEIKDYWPLPDRVPPELLISAKNHPTYFIIYQSQVVPLGWKLKLLQSYQQGTSQDHLRLYQVLPL